jgi:predicted RNase H-like HicB family nuclease
MAFPLIFLSLIFLSASSSVFRAGFACVLLAGETRRDEFMKREFTAVIKQDEGWWIGWLEEIPGVNSQSKTKGELLKNLKSALKEALEFNRTAARAAAQSDYEEALILA